MPHQPQSESGACARQRSGVATGRKAGFTVTELLVALGVIAVLLGIMLPVLARARGEGAIVAALANQRSAFQALSHYMLDQRDAYPFYGLPGTHSAPLTVSGTLIDDRYWGQPRYWGLYLHARGYEGWTSLGHDAHPNSYEELLGEDCTGCTSELVSMHFLTNVVFAEPRFWSQDGTPDKSLHRGMRGADVAYSSLKAILIMRTVADPANPQARTLMHFADGRGEVVRFVDLLPGVARTGMDFGGWPAFSTVNGVLGRDR